MKRKFVRFKDAAAVAGYEEWWQVEYQNMGFCKDGVTRWYWFDAEDGTPCYTVQILTTSRPGGYEGTTGSTLYGAGLGAGLLYPPAGSTPARRTNAPWTQGEGLEPWRS